MSCHFWFLSLPVRFLHSCLYVKNSLVPPTPSTPSTTQLYFTACQGLIYVTYDRRQRFIWSNLNPGSSAILSVMSEGLRDPTPRRSRPRFNTPSQEQWTAWRLLDLMGWGGDKDACSAALTDGGAAPPPTGHPPRGSQNKWLQGKSSDRPVRRRSLRALSQSAACMLVPTLHSAEGLFSFFFLAHPDSCQLAFM